jgi:hypothetical protein
MSGMKKFWSGQEKPVGTAKRCFRVKVVGSNPTGPTKNAHLVKVSSKFTPNGKMVEWHD